MTQLYFPMGNFVVVEEGVTHIICIGCGDDTNLADPYCMCGDENPIPVSQFPCPAGCGRKSSLIKAHSLYAKGKVPRCPGCGKAILPEISSQYTIPEWVSSADENSIALCFILVILAHRWKNSSYPYESLIRDLSLGPVDGPITQRDFEVYLKFGIDNYRALLQLPGGTSTATTTVAWVEGTLPAGFSLVELAFNKAPAPNKRHSHALGILHQLSLAINNVDMTRSIEMWQHYVRQNASLDNSMIDAADVYAQKFGKRFHGLFTYTLQSGTGTPNTTAQISVFNQAGQQVGTQMNISGPIDGPVIAGPVGQIGDTHQVVQQVVNWGTGAVASGGGVAAGAGGVAIAGSVPGGIQIGRRVVTTNVPADPFDQWGLSVADNYTPERMNLIGDSIAVANLIHIAKAEGNNKVVASLEAILDSTEIGENISPEQKVQVSLQCMFYNLSFDQLASIRLAKSKSNSGGGAHIEGDLNVTGTFVGRDKKEVYVTTGFYNG